MHRLVNRLHSSQRPLEIASKAQRGVSLLEVLITVLVLSVGLLGLAALQATGTKFNHGAYLRTQATALAYEMSDRMRTDIGGDFVTGLANVYDASVGPACGVTLGGATPAREVNQWKSCVENALPLGRGRVTRLAAGTVYNDACAVAHPAADVDTFVIEVTWDNSRLQNEAADACVVLRTEVRPL